MRLLLPAAALLALASVSVCVSGCRTDPRPSTGPADSGAPCTLNVDCDSGAPVEAGLGGSPCAQSADCGGGLYCHKPHCRAPTGTCQPQPQFLGCTADGGTSAVCGCDHETYGNACEAASSGVDVATVGACPPLPSGPCASQADCGGADYAEIVFCKPAACGQATGQCTLRPDSCTFEVDLVCGCDGNEYLNSCFSDAAGVGEAYGGPCRSGDLVACGGTDGGAACAGGQVCAVDPRPCDAGAGCSGVCLDTPGAACGPFTWNDAGWVQSCGSTTQACAASASGDCDGGGCGVCVYTTGAACDGGAACAPGELCVPALTCGGGGGACPGYCVVP